MRSIRNRITGSKTNNLCTQKPHSLGSISTPPPPLPQKFMSIPYRHHLSHFNPTPQTKNNNVKEEWRKNGDIEQTVLNSNMENITIIIKSFKINLDKFHYNECRSNVWTAQTKWFMEWKWLHPFRMLVATNDYRTSGWLNSHEYPAGGKLDGEWPCAVYVRDSLRDNTRSSNRPRIVLSIVVLVSMWLEYGWVCSFC